MLGDFRDAVGWLDYAQRVDGTLPAAVRGAASRLARTRLRPFRRARAPDAEP